ncbi:MAG: hypothetical protein RLY66_689 [Candidatus Parcubacteria bacterium]|jgi:hypothetical protein
MDINSAQRGSIRAYWLVLASVALAISIAFFYSADARIVLHAVVNVFATGRTGVKAIVFFIYVFCVAAILYIRSNSGITAGKLSFWGKMAIVSALGAYVLNFVTYLWMMKTWHIPTFTYSLVYDKGAFTSLQFIHNHVTKGVIAVFTQFFPEGFFGHLDSGTALLGIVPHSVFFVQAALVIVVTVSIFMVWKHVSPQMNVMKPARGVLFGAVLAMSSFMVIKSLLDGGMLSFEAVIGMSFFILLVSGESSLAKKTLIGMNLAYIALLGVLYWFGYFALDINYGYHTFSAVTAFLCLTALYGLYSVGRTRLSVLVLIMALIPFGVQVYNGVDIFGYHAVSIDRGDTAYILSYNDIGISGYVKRASIGSVSLYTVSPQESLTVGDIIPLTGFSGNTTPVSVAWKTCIPSAPPTRYVFDLVAPHEIDAVSDTDQFYRMNAQLIQKYDNNLYHYEIVLNTNQCFVPQQIVFVQEVLAKHFDRFAIYNIQQFENGE